MFSLDVTSLYTNVAVNETIEIILKQLYETKRRSTPTIKRADFRKLLVFATKNTHFMFNENLYDQINGVSMGAPLAPLLAEIFIQDFERKTQGELGRMGIRYWRRYVDDIFVMIDPITDTKDLTRMINLTHPSIQFTCEIENLEKQLPFLDVLITRTNHEFRTQVYRKPTYTRLMTKWDSYVRKSYKKNAISSMVYRAIKICSSFTLLHQEFEFIQTVAQENGYPLQFVESIIRRELGMVLGPTTVARQQAPQEKIDNVVFRVPFFGNASTVYTERIKTAVKKIYPRKIVRIVYDTKARAGDGFSTKDKVPDCLKSGLVYEATCPTCGDNYIGKTCRHLKTRVHEHLSDQNKCTPSKSACVTKKSIHKTVKQVTAPRITGPITRQSTGKLPPSTRQVPQQDLDEALATLTKMFSLDVTSLYTNVPVDETIEIILKQLYEAKGRSTPTGWTGYVIGYVAVFVVSMLKMTE
ncbi:unnamed protein product [Didymodactylos carnosus]|uniref:Reverse transcriptase domain-containing protein n=1 Tax=Didymodactylos carnosus TaxID=1234261 RepID=A0A8S2DET8_9BILA|nr:unnamed protein product [Didymodactylos carnosus]CAF3723846.1 unnamed protein product [Didymodactylos carnosus]